MHGNKDNVVPIGQSELLHSALTNAGVKSTYHVVDGVGHGFGKRPEVDEAVARFFGKHLKASR